MLLNEHNNLVSLRTKPSLSLISISFEDENICLDAPGVPTLRISIQKDVSDNQVFEFKLWEQVIKGKSHDGCCTICEMAHNSKGYL